MNSTRKEWSIVMDRRAFLDLVAASMAAACVPPALSGQTARRFDIERDGARLVMDETGALLEFGYHGVHDSLERVRLLKTPSARFRMEL